MPAKREPFRALFSCVGRRVELVRAFDRAAKALKLPYESWGTDCVATAPALSFVDRAKLVPRITDPAYLDRMISLVRRGRIRLLVPLIDLELVSLAHARPQFAETGCTVLISGVETVETCRDKLATYKHLAAAGIDTPATWTLDDAMSMRDEHFPLFVKPRFGSASIGLHTVAGLSELQLVARRVEEPIVQEFVRGPEYTIDAYAGFDGKPACVVPRRRLRVRGGEVVESQVCLDRDVMEVGRRVVSSLEECVGVITIQCIRRENGSVAVIEINPRFGGGVPLSIEAGADMPKWVLAALAGRRLRIPPTARRNGLLMNRYDCSVFLKPPREPSRPVRGRG